MGADRALDWNCDGLPGNATVSHALSKQGPVHTAYDEWGNLHLAFQQNVPPPGCVAAEPPKLDAYGPVRPDPDLRETADRARRSPDWPRATLYGGACTTPVIPRTGTAWRVPLVVYGSARFDVTTMLDPLLSGAAPVTVHDPVDLDGDGHLDAWLEFRPVDTALHTSAIEADLYAEVPDGPTRTNDVFAAFDITRPSSPADPDGDGIPTACDACPQQGGDPLRGPDGCPCSLGGCE